MARPTAVRRETNAEIRKQQLRQRGRLSWNTRDAAQGPRSLALKNRKPRYSLLPEDQSL